MDGIDLKKEPQVEVCSGEHVMLKKDSKPICRCVCSNLPTNIKKVWTVSIIPQELVGDLSSLPSCSLVPAPENNYQYKEWDRFFSFLLQHKKAAEVELDYYKLYIFPPKGSNLCYATMVYPKKASIFHYDNKMNGGLGARNSEAQGLAIETDGQPREPKNYMETHPSYLKTLGQAHSAWIFGAIAELVDNARDAKATKLQISIDLIYSKTVQKEIPMLSVVDDGHGMTYQEIRRMISFGHKQPEADDPDCIGRFGIGFKSGAMRLGKDALVLTQTAESRSIAFLSQTLNEGKDNLEIPIVSYRRIGQYMDMDTKIQNADLSKRNLRAIFEHSPFNEYLIGEKTALFMGKSSGTQIYIWNLDERRSKCSLEWEDGIAGKSSYHHGDIKVRSKRVRTRPGQMSQQVELDYSLRSYLEVIFFEPRMKIYIQGGVVKSRPLAKTLHKTFEVKDTVMEKPVKLTIGRCQLEWERANCGIFLYWHGRLIEAYKRVGSMIHNGDRGRGVIGVIDVTKLMKDDQGHVWVHNNKQGFQDCEEYAELEKWLGEVTDAYVDKHVDKIPLKKGNATYEADHDWVQCDKCRKWRMLSIGFSVNSLPDEWFCYMEPFNERCDVPEEKEDPGVIAISEKRSRSSWVDEFTHEDRSEQTAEGDVGQTPTRRIDNDTIPVRNTGAFKKRSRNVKVSFSNKDITPKRNTGRGVEQAPSRRRFYEQRAGGIKNSPWTN